MHLIRLIGLCLGLALGLGTLSAQAEDPRMVDANLVTALDVSGSISIDEERIQYEGMAGALTDPRFLRALRLGARGAVGFFVYTWSSHGNVEIVVPWSLIDSPDAARAVADRLRAQEPTQRDPGDKTDITLALHTGMTALAEAPYFGERQLINVVSDGSANSGGSPRSARDAALDRGINVNALLVSSSEHLRQYYEAQVAGGPGSFVIDTPDHHGFGQAILRKFLTEMAAL